MTHTISPSSHHLADSCQGWPKLLFAVYERDATALVDSFVGYGVAALPLSPGAHDVSACVFVANDRNARAAQSARGGAGCRSLVIISSPKSLSHPNGPVGARGGEIPSARGRVK